MIPFDNRKILFQLILIGIAITMYDVMLHSFFSILHFAFEWFELALEKIVEHIFHTNRQQSQIIVFYLLWLIALLGLYRLWRMLRVFYSQLKEQLVATSLRYKSYMAGYWSEQSLIHKIKWLTTFSVSVSCLALFVFS